MPFRVTRGLLFVIAVAAAVRLTAAPTHLVDERPVGITAVQPGVWLVDFGRAAFGNVRLAPAAGASGRVTVHFGEALANGRINRTPPGSVRYARAEVSLEGKTAIVAAPPPDARNTRQVDPPRAARPGVPPEPATPPAVLTPATWGVVLPFRWVEIEGWPGNLTADALVRQTAYATTWNDTAAAFACSDSQLTRIWELCRYSIKATTFAGVYVDGDRERIPYEADAYLTQLSAYAVDGDVQMARDTFAHLLRYPTWPTEWASHMVFMAEADWWQTGDKAWLGAQLDALRSKLLLDRVGPDGLITSTPAQMKKGDLVDWPAGERDGFVFTRVNAVANAFFIRALDGMADLCLAAGRASEAETYRRQAATARAAFQEKFFNPATGHYRDGLGTDHESLHTNAFALAFGVVPPERRPAVLSWIAARQMDCSVYAAQYFLEALLRGGRADRAVALMLAPGDRSWRHMLESGTTITWEAWDQKYKPNQDWNHAWGAAPANLLPRFILGVTPAQPGWERVAVAPQTGGLTWVRGRVPTPHGAVLVNWSEENAFRLELSLPPGVAADVSLPATRASGGVTMNGSPVAATRVGDRWVLDQPVRGPVTVVVQ